MHRRANLQINQSSYVTLSALKCKLFPVQITQMRITKRDSTLSITRLWSSGFGMAEDSVAETSTMRRNVATDSIFDAVCVCLERK